MPLLLLKDRRSRASLVADFLGGTLLRKTLTIAGLASALVAVMFILVTLEVTQRRTEAHATARLNELAESMSVMASVACFARDSTLARETTEAFIKNREVLRVTIIAHGQVLATSARAEAEGQEPGSGRQHPLRRAVYSPFAEDEQIGEIVLVPNGREIEQNVADDVRFVSLLLLLMVAGIGSIIALAVTVYVVRPVREISDNVHMLDAAADDLIAVPSTHERNELGRLVKDINDLMVRLRTSLNREHALHLQKVIDERLRLAAAVFEHSLEGITITDRANRIVTVNQAFTRITGYGEAEVVGQNPRLLASGRHDRDFFRQMWHAIETQGHWQGEIWNRCKNGEVIPNWISINVVRDAAGEIANHIAIFSDISERKMADERISFLAHHDPLTSLPNRILVRDRFEQAAAAASREGARVAMLYLDLDHFKDVNDSLGHQAGDRLLLAVVERIRRVIRESDTISRHGGDEFLVLVGNLQDLAIVERICRELLDELSAGFDIDGDAIGISASVGIACYPEDGADFDALLRNADVAMYAAKAAGRNGYRFFTNDMNVDARERLRLKAYLQTALENRELQLYFQPQVELSSGRLIGAEVLLRWTHPELGMVSPARFIPLAEESGLINEIGEWVLHESCRQAAQWFGAGIPPFVVAVNIAAQQFNRANIEQIVGDALRRSGLRPSLLELELTESGLLIDLTQSLETIDRLKALGVNLAIDDFGTGYSSLSYLKQFKVGKLKVDQSFVRDLEHDKDDLAIVRAIIQMSKTLNLNVIAEGVETQEQLRILEGMGCDEAQGYHFARPMPAEDFERWLADWKPGTAAF